MTAKSKLQQQSPKTTVHVVNKPPGILVTTGKGQVKEMSLHSREVAMEEAEHTDRGRWFHRAGVHWH